MKIYLDRLKAPGGSNSTTTFHTRVTFSKTKLLSSSKKIWNSRFLFIFNAKIISLAFLLLTTSKNLLQIRQGNAFTKLVRIHLAAESYGSSALFLAMINQFQVKIFLCLTNHLSYKNALSEGFSKYRISAC